MSGLLERIVRRRRVSADRRLGPPAPPDDDAAPNGRPAANGTAGAERALRAYHAVRTLPVHDDDALVDATTEPAPDEPATEAPPGEPPAAPGLRERSRMRRRARYLRQLRELQLRDIGGFVLELHRFERERPDLVQAKVESAASTDAELRALNRALELGQPLRELREPGIGGACPTCGAVYGSADRFCASCGDPLQAEEPAEPLDPIDLGQVYPE